MIPGQQAEDRLDPKPRGPSSLSRVLLRHDRCERASWFTTFTQLKRYQFMIHQPAFQMCYFHMTSNGWIYGVPPVMKIVRDPALSIKTLKFDEDEPVGAHGPMTLSRSDSLSCRRVTTYTWVTLGARQRHSPPNTRSINHRNHRQSTHTLIQRKWAHKQLGQRNHNHKNILLLTAIPRMQLANSNARSTTRPAMHLMWGFSFVNNFFFFLWTLF